LEGKTIEYQTLDSSPHFMINGKQEEEEQQEQNVKVTAPFL